MKQLLITIAALVLVGCGESQQSTPAPEPQTATAPDFSIHDAAIDGNIEAVKQHIAAGADVNAKDDYGLTPLHFAAGAGHKEIVELLIAKGADVNTKDSDGETHLHWAIRLGNTEIAELLIANGADVNAKFDDGINGRTALDIAKSCLWRRPETASLLRKHGGKTGEELKAEGN